MLISPPFLPNRPVGQSDDDWLRAAIIEGRPGDGYFPVSHNLGWHGGSHLTAPTSSAQTERVRAIADGTVIFKRDPTPALDDPKHPQNYRGGWTDNGCVVIRHESAIGEGANASSIIFFSIYMHLSAIHPNIKNGGKVNRKDELGKAGQIYGDTVRKIHFEIVTDDANLGRLLGRQNGELDVRHHGRSDAVYGELFFRLPVGTQFYSEKPLSNLVQAHKQPPKPAPKAPLPAIVPLTEVYTSDQVLIVSLRYLGNTSTQAGDAFLSTLSHDGVEFGTALREEGAGYDLYDSAVDISDSFSVNVRPAPSTVFELLRFGRIINTNDEVAMPTEVPHWRQVNFPNGRGWVNLNAEGVTKFSDADFPHWRGWNIIDDSADHDSRCDSPIVKTWLNPQNGDLDQIQMAASLSEPSVALKLSKAICKFPSEWESTTIDTRWGWLKQSSTDNPSPLGEEEFAELKKHITALCFDAREVTEAQWHWPPFQFFSHFRKCGWLSQQELIRCIPARYHTEERARGSRQILVNISTSVAQQRVVRRNSDTFMKICRKYDIDKRLRLAHFLAQIFRESGVLQYDQELASGAEYQGRADLGNINPGDGIRYKGRGLIQTTGKTNYQKYSDYRGKRGRASFVNEPNNLLLATVAYNCADTAGLYWVSRAVARHQLNINRLADIGASESDLRAVTRNVNGAEDGRQTGLFERRSHLTVLCAVLLDTVQQITPAIERRNA
jgi:hydroxyethylthiazole kinase